ncbi:MAG TPA: hypothetical protein VFH97_01660 [Gemmatimonadales bacterium]|nr:hypothetical protein [Gemmatimonadales bacterium]
MSRTLLGLVGLLTLLLPAEAAAQRRGIRPVHPHDGFWLSFGAGGGWEEFDVTGGSFSLRMGGTPNPRFLFGGEVTGWLRESGFSDISRVNVMATALLYPSRAGGWFLKGGFGFAEHSVDGFDRSGLGLSAGTGFDIRLGRNFYLTPTVDYLAQFFDENTSEILLVTLGLTWH